MQNFHNVSFPDFLARAASASVSYLTHISESVTGNEVRKIERAVPIRKYIIKNSLCTSQEYEEFISFFQSRKGAGYAFRFRDYFDYKVKNQKIIIKDKFVASKYYTDGNESIIRSNIYVITETMDARYDDSKLLLSKENFNEFILQEAFDQEREIVVNYEFDVIVRFNQDEVKYFLDPNGAIIIENIELVEVIL